MIAPRSYFEDALLDLGKCSRVLFFVGTVAGGFWLLTLLPTDIANTPFAQLTLHMLFTQAYRAVGIVLVGWAWLAWAFAAGPKDYRAWGWLGLSVGLAVLVMVIAMAVQNA